MEAELNDAITEILEKTGTKIDLVFLSPKVSQNGTGEVNRSRVTISNTKGSFTFTHYESGYNTLYGERDDGVECFRSAMLDSLKVGNGVSFEDFCSENGYDKDEGKELAKKTYDNLVKADSRLRSLFDVDVFNKLSRIVKESL